MWVMVSNVPTNLDNVILIIWLWKACTIRQHDVFNVLFCTSMNSRKKVFFLFVNFPKWSLVFYKWKMAASNEVNVQKSKERIAIKQTYISEPTFSEQLACQRKLNSSLTKFQVIFFFVYLLSICTVLFHKELFYEKILLTYVIL